MAVPNELAKVQALAEEGFFDKARDGDHRACGLFARYVAYRLNPTGDPSSWGWLSKNPGEAQVDGYSEDGIVYGSNPTDFQNVVDIISGAGQRGARIAWQPQPRRRGNDWVKPRPLTDEEMRYLSPSFTPGPEPPPAAACPDPARHNKPDCPDPKAHEPKPYPGDRVWDEIGRRLHADMKRAGQEHLNAESGTWWGRTIWRVVNEGMSLDESIAQSQREWRAVLGL